MQRLTELPVRRSFPSTGVAGIIAMAIMVTVVLMGIADLTFNIMTLGGLALGVHLLFLIWRAR